MLYKKYHRNFVKQFRKEVKFSYKNSYSSETYKDTVRIEPFYDEGIIHMIGKKYSWILIYSNGIVDYEVKIEENAIQEIS